MQTRLHQLDVFYANPCLPGTASARAHKRWWSRAAETFQQAPTDNNHQAIVVLGLTSEADQPAMAPTWGIHFIGDPDDYQSTYWDYLRERFELSPQNHLIAPDSATLRKQLLASRKRARWLTSQELAERGIVRQHWALAPTDHYDLVPPSPIRVDARRDVLSLDLTDDVAIYAMVRHTLALKDAAYPDVEKDHRGYHLARLFFGLPFNSTEPVPTPSMHRHHHR